MQLLKRAVIREQACEQLVLATRQVLPCKMAGILQTVVHIWELWEQDHLLQVA